VPVVCALVRGGPGRVGPRPLSACDASRVEWSPAASTWSRTWRSCERHRPIDRGERSDSGRQRAGGANPAGAVGGDAHVRRQPDVRARFREDADILRTIEALRDRWRFGVVEADIDSTVDAERWRRPVSAPCSSGPAASVTSTRRWWPRASPRSTSTRWMRDHRERRNLVCPAEFDTGAIKNVMILSVPEGDDKPLKYPLMFSVSDALLVNKMDYLPLSDFDLEAMRERVLRLNRTSRSSRSRRRRAGIASGRRGSTARRGASSAREHAARQSLSTSVRCTTDRDGRTRNRPSPFSGVDLRTPRAGRLLRVDNTGRRPRAARTKRCRGCARRRPRRVAAVAARSAAGRRVVARSAPPSGARRRPGGHGCTHARLDNRLRREEAGLDGRPNPFTAVRVREPGGVADDEHRVVEEGPPALAVQQVRVPAERAARPRGIRRRSSRKPTNRRTCSPSRCESCRPSPMLMNDPLRTTQP